MITVGPVELSTRDAIIVAWVPFLVAAARRLLLWWDAQAPATPPPAVFGDAGGEPTVPLDVDQAPPDD